MSKLRGRVGSFGIQKSPRSKSSATFLAGQQSGTGRSNPTAKRRPKQNYTTPRTLVDQMNAMCITEVAESDEAHGDFLADFARICAYKKISYVPEIISRSHPPSHSLDESTSTIQPDLSRLGDKRSHRGAAQRGTKSRKASILDPVKTESKTSLAVSVHGDQAEKAQQNQQQTFLGKTVPSSLALPTSTVGLTAGSARQKKSSRTPPAPYGEDTTLRLPLKEDGTDSDTATTTGASFSQKTSKESVTDQFGKGREQLQGSHPTMPETKMSKPPTTFTTRDRFSYFKPCIQVEEVKMDSTVTTVTEIYIRGWKVDEAMMEVFHQCWTVLPKLHTVNMWNVALDTPTFHLMTSFLPLCSRLNTLVLDGNTLAGMAVSSLIAEYSHLQHLSLRFCGLTDIEAYGIGSNLGSESRNNVHLLTLNLSNNRITDLGVKHIAEGLKMNRTLLTLNLASNRFGDEGAAFLSIALSQFPLTHHQIIKRRQLLSRKTGKENVRPGSGASNGMSSKWATGRATPSKEHRDKDGGKRQKDSKFKLRLNPASSKRKLSWGKDTSPTKKELAESLRGRSRRSSDGRPHRSGKHTRSTDDELDMSEGSSSKVLMDVGEFRDGQLWLTGNRALISLNLSRNRIGQPGMKKMLEAVECQVRPLHINFRQLNVGLRRLVVHRNAVPEDDVFVKAIQKYMRLRDPFFRSPFINLSKTFVTPCSIPVAE